MLPASACHHIRVDPRSNRFNQPKHSSHTERRHNLLLAQTTVRGLQVSLSGRPWRVGALLKEAVDDLEWAAAGGHQSARSAVHLVMRRDPRALTLFAKGAGELKVCVEPCSCHRAQRAPASCTTFKNALHGLSDARGCRRSAWRRRMLRHGAQHMLHLVPYQPAKLPLAAFVCSLYEHRTVTAQNV